MFMYKVLKPEFVATHKALYDQLKEVREGAFEPLRRVTEKHGGQWDYIESIPPHQRSAYEQKTHDYLHRLFMDVNHAATETNYRHAKPIVNLILDLENYGCHYIIPMHGYRVDESKAVNGVFYMEAHHKSPIDAVPFINEVTEAVEPVIYGQSPADVSLRDLFEGGMHQPISLPTAEQLKQGLSAYRFTPDGKTEPIEPSEFLKALLDATKKK